MIYQVRKPYTFVSMDKEDDENVFNRKEFVYGVDARSNVGFGLWQLAYASREALDSKAFNDAYAQMRSVKGDNGRTLNIRPKLLVVNPTMRAQALEVVKAERNANGATNINRDVVGVPVQTETISGGPYGQASQGVARHRQAGGISSRWIGIRRRSEKYPAGGAFCGRT